MENMTSQPQDIGPVLIANRGEIARRIIKTARLRGLPTVAVHSDADADAPFVAEADYAVRLPGVTPTDTYLNVPKILEAARQTGARSIHPGYGFLSENADFAQAVLDAGLIWIGPDPQSITDMGAKTKAKELMEASDVPVLGNLDVSEVTEDMLPVLVKASAGGGGRGMRVVSSLDELASQVKAAAAEAGSAFGDDTVFIERYITSGRHIEVQIVADAHGTVWAVGERECSIQRRHQKVLEEAPSPLVEGIDGMRDRLFTAAINAAKATNYRGAGTVEFLADNDGSFYFLEMNTRLQVEHPVTEATTGLDLVGLQFDIAAGLPLPAEQPPASTGWSIEARLYAEDPANEWRPMAGDILTLDFDNVTSEFEGPATAGLRVDSGLVPRPGKPATVGTHYDAMLSKVITLAPTRHEAVSRLSAALRQAKIHGIGTNRDLLVRILEDPDFRSGDFDTSFLSEARLEKVSAPLADEHSVAMSAFAAAVAIESRDIATMPTPPVKPAFRNVGMATSEYHFSVQDETITAQILRDRNGVISAGGDLTDVRALDVEHRETDSVVRLEHGSVTIPVIVSTYSDGTVATDSVLGPVSMTELPRYEDPSLVATEGSLLSPMPGSIISVDVTNGQTVKAGQALMSMEAMKMEHAIRATADGVVTDISVAVGDQVDAGKVLAIVSGDEEE